MKNFDEVEKELYEQITGKQAPAFEVRKEDDLYLVGPFWLVADSLKELLNCNFKLLNEKFLVDYQGNYVNRVPRSQFTHKGIWETKYKGKYNQVSFDYYPRGRVSYDREENVICVNIPSRLKAIQNHIVNVLAKEYGFKAPDIKIRYTDPTQQGQVHYNFTLK